MAISFNRRLFLKWSAIVGGTVVSDSSQAASSPEERDFVSCLGELGTSRYLQGIYRPEAGELEETPLDSKGVHKLVPGLNGVFLQQSSNPLFPDLTLNYHWFDGDGKPTAIIFRDGKAYQVSRFIDTEKHLEEAKLQATGASKEEIFNQIRHSLYGFLSNQSIGKVLDEFLPFRNTANTDFFYHRPRNKRKGECWATWYGNTEQGVMTKKAEEKTRSAYLIDPVSLETKDFDQMDKDIRWRLNGTRLRGIPAHAKQDTETNQTFFLDHHYLTDVVNVGEIDGETGEISHLCRPIRLGRPIFFHDWFMSDHGVIIPATPFGPSKMMGALKILAH
ncbi:MAG: carotenoid oxygenase family protein, partial [Pseudomonadota bacterium]